LYSNILKPLYFDAELPYNGSEETLMHNYLKDFSDFERFIAKRILLELGHSLYLSKFEPWTKNNFDCQDELFDS